MKKKLLAAVAIGMALVMQSVTVLAAPSPNTTTVTTTDDSDSSSDSETTTDTATTTEEVATTETETLDVTYPTATQVRVFTVSGAVGETGTTQSTVGIVKDASGVADDIAFGEISAEDDAKITEKVNEILGEATADGVNVTDATAFEIEPVEGSSVSGVFIVAWDSVTVADAGKVAVFHLKDGVWEQVQVNVFDGMLQIITPNGYSPFIVVKYDQPIVSTNAGASYSAAPTSTVSGATAPKTGDAYPYVAVIAMAALAGLVVSSRKLAKN